MSCRNRAGQIPKSLQQETTLQLQASVYRLRWRIEDSFNQLEGL